MRDNGGLFVGCGWTVVPAPAAGIDGRDPAVPARLGLALLPDALGSASGARDETPDRSGRRVIRATIFEPVPGPTDVPGVGRLFAGAEVVVTLDRSGDVARVVLTLPPEGDPSLVVDVEVSLG